jgi:hypothetical protein
MISIQGETLVVRRDFILGQSGMGAILEADNQFVIPGRREAPYPESRDLRQSL